MDYYNVSQAARVLCVTAQTLRNWEKEGILIPHHKTKYGYRYYSKEQLDNYLYRDAKLNIGYIPCFGDSDSVKVSKIKQELSNVGKNQELIVDNAKKDGLKNILVLITDNQVSKLITDIESISESDKEILISMRDLYNFKLINV